MSDCLFCKIIARQIPGTIVAEDDRALAFRDIHPGAPTHVLVVPRKHFAGLSDASDDDAELIGHVLLMARDVAKKEGLSDYRIAINNGPGVGQSVFHLHVHLLGGRAMSWPPG
jgi:histidine triad (HIT) family protein